MTFRHSQSDLSLKAFSQSDPLYPVQHNLNDGATGLYAPFTENEIVQAIQKTLPTIPGRDGISAKLLQGLSFENTPPK